MYTTTPLGPHPRMRISVHCAQACSVRWLREGETGSLALLGISVILGALTHLSPPGSNAREREEEQMMKWFENVAG